GASPGEEALGKKCEVPAQPVGSGGKEPAGAKVRLTARQSQRSRRSRENDDDRARRSERGRRRERRVDHAEPRDRRRRRRDVRLIAARHCEEAAVGSVTNRRPPWLQSRLRCLSPLSHPSASGHSLSRLWRIRQLRLLRLRLASFATAPCGVARPAWTNMPGQDPGLANLPSNRQSRGRQAQSYYEGSTGGEGQSGSKPKLKKKQRKAVSPPPENPQDKRGGPPPGPDGDGDSSGPSSRARILTGLWGCALRELAHRDSETETERLA
ncbi:unnamed protein product, partial [Effrenium voratum]